MNHPGKVPKEYQKALRSIKRKVKRRGIALRFSIGRTVHTTNEDVNGSSGYYWYEKEIAVSIDRSIDSWMGILIHESCHMDQDFDKTISQEIKNKWISAAEAFFDWLEGKKQMNTTQLDNVINTIVELEKDCEIRSVAFIEKWNLPIDIDEYIRSANLYLYMHQIYKEQRKFYSIMNHSDIGKALQLCPSTFQENYLTIPSKLRAEILKLSVIVNS